MPKTEKNKRRILSMTNLVLASS